MYQAVEMRWSMALGITFAHALITYAGFRLLGETALIESAVQYIYFYIVVGSSVGFGDFSPISDGGKIFTATWVIPGAISLFALMIGKIVGAITVSMRKTMNGYGNYANKAGHVVVIGHVPGQTAKLLEETHRLHGSRDVVIVATQDLSGQQQSWEFVRASSLSCQDDLARAGVKSADFVVVLGHDDDESLSACLATSALSPQGHVVAYFRQDGNANLVKAHCPEIEVVTSISTEQVARALSDPGAGEVLRHLVSTKLDGTLGSLVFTGADHIKIEALSDWLRHAHRATLIGYRSADGAETIITLDADAQIHEGQTIFYIASKRLPDGATYKGTSQC